MSRDQSEETAAYTQSCYSSKLSRSRMHRDRWSELASAMDGRWPPARAGPRRQTEARFIPGISAHPRPRQVVTCYNPTSIGRRRPLALIFVSYLLLRAQNNTSRLDKRSSCVSFYLHSAAALCGGSFDDRTMKYIC